MFKTVSVKSLSNPDIDRLLAKHLLGETTVEEEERVRQWTDADAQHELYVHEFRRTWEESKRLAPPRLVDKSAAWERLLQSGKLPAESIASQHRPKIILIGRRGVWQTMLALAIGILSTLGKRVPGDNPIAALSLQTAAEVRTDTLPDGSRVTLNKYSSLALPAHWGRNSRAVQLKGEAFFQVVHEDKRPFTVQIGDLTIHDLGTEFNVKSTNDRTEIIVESGAVSVSNGKFTATAVAGEKVIVSSVHTGLSNTTSDDQLYQYYHTKRFVCRKTPLSVFVAALNEAYDAHIVIEGESVHNAELTATFADANLDQILKVVTLTLGLEMQRKGDSIILKQASD